MNKQSNSESVSSFQLSACVLLQRAMTQLSLRAQLIGFFSGFLAEDSNKLKSYQSPICLCQQHRVCFMPPPSETAANFPL